MEIPKVKLIFDLTKIPPNKREKLYEAERLLNEVGVSFSCTTEFSDLVSGGPKALAREWSFDHELKGPVKIEVRSE